MADVLIFVIGMCVSAFGTIIGFGGSVFMVPILIIFFNFPMPIAIGASMAALLPSSLIASFFNYREKNIDYLVGSLIQLPAVAGTVAGSFLVAFLPVLELQFIFAFFVIIVGGLMLRPKKHKENPTRQGVMYRVRRAPTSFIRKNRAHHLAYRLNGALVTTFGLISGMMAGLLGIGGGFLQTPVMIRVFKMPPQIATSTSLFILVITSLTGFITHYMLDHVVFSRSIALVIGFSLGAVAGRLYKKRRTKKLAIDKLIGMGLLLAGMGVIANIIIKADLFLD